MHYFVFRNLAAAGLDRTWLTAVLWILALIFPLTRLLTFRYKNGLLRVCYWIGAVWMGSVFLLAFWFLVSMLARKGLKLAGLSAASDSAAWIATTAAAVLAMILWGLFNAWRGPKEVRFTLDRSARYGKGKRLRLVQISDVHLGLTLGVEFLQSLVERINKLDPDLVLLTGDFFDPEFPGDDQAVEILKTLRAGEGIYAVSGNHEFYSGLDRFLVMMEKSGIPVLNNETKTTKSGMQVCGIHDQTANRFKALGVTCDLGKAVATIDPSMPSILLAHQPKELEPAIDKRVDLILSGHTHAGQVFPFRFVVRLAYKYLGGRYNLGPETDLVVNTGTGFWGPPLRLGTDSQIVVVDFKF
jgi:predicted MPP superfamily phosphohydrolase